jgi:ketosteroid isomerase-like protein
LMSVRADGPGMSGDPEALARVYYRHIDDGAYGPLREVLADEFVQHRPDTTLEGADRFVRFMREERPETDTTHAVECVYRVGGDGAASDTEGTGEGGGTDETADARVAVEGRLERADGRTWFRFVDVFTVADGRLTGLRTYTGGGGESGE